MFCVGQVADNIPVSAALPAAACLRECLTGPKPVLDVIRHWPRLTFYRRSGAWLE